MKLSIVIPLYNESEVIPELYRRLIHSLKKDFKSFTYEIIFVDDGSSDKTFAVLKKYRAKDKRVKIIQFSRNFGHHIAISAGMDIAKGNYIVIMDGDLQDQPEEIINLFKKLKEGYDVVYAERMNRQFGFIKNFNSRMFNWLIRKMIKEKIVINSTIFRILTRQVNDEIKNLRESNRYLVGIIGWVGFKHAVQPVAHGARFAGETKYTLRKQIELALNAIFSYSRYPLTFIVNIGLVFILIAFGILLYTIYTSVTFKLQFIRAETILSAVCFLGGVQIIILGVLGEYMGRNYIENKNRPLYVIKELLL